MDLCRLNNIHQIMHSMAAMEHFAYEFAVALKCKNYYVDGTKWVINLHMELFVSVKFF